MSTTFFDYLTESLGFERTRLQPWRVVNLLKLVWQIRRERNQLAALSQKELDDIGLPPRDAMRETGRGLLDLPKSRLDNIYR